MRHSLALLLLSYILTVPTLQTIAVRPAEEIRTERNDSIEKKRCEATFAPLVSYDDPAVAEILLEKVRNIIGRVGCGAPDAQYRIVPVLVIEEVNTTSGLVKNVTVAKGSLTLQAVSADNPDMVWHSAVIPLEATITGDGKSPGEALARQIKVSDAAYVRFIRVARKRISENEISVNTREP